MRRIGSVGCLRPSFEKLAMLDGRDAPRCHQGRWKAWWKLTMIFTTGFLVDFGRLRPAFRGRQETARFPSGPASAPITPPGAEFHAFCVGTFDLASVSPIVRSFSNSVRRTPPIVSANLRQKPPLIARRPHFDCAPLHLAPMMRPPVSSGDVPAKEQTSIQASNEDNTQRKVEAYHG